MQKHNLRGFDFTLHVRRLCDDMVRRLPELHHVDLARVAMNFCQTRKRVTYGHYASLTPLRFAGGSMETVRRGRKWGIQRVVDASGREMLYILSVYLPRFMNLAFREKVATVLHELWHISPRFDGDLRRFGGRCYAHSGSQKRYDALMDRLAAKWLSLNPPEEVYDFLRVDMAGLVARHGRIFGQRYRAPKLVPL
jgi:predicted metallopeptidase